MKFTLPWLFDHLDTTASLDEICYALPRLGFVVSSVEDEGARRLQKLSPFIVAQILETQPHPQADRLQVCKVDAGQESALQIVCGAPNARPGINVVLGQPGDKIPATGAVLKNSQIRGVDSAGMLCSAAELNVGIDADGIIELPSSFTPGTPLAQILDAWLGVQEPVIEIEVTPNRGDVLSVRGIARELAAAGLGTLRPLHKEETPHTSTPAPSFCPLFTTCLVRGVHNGPSPAWLQSRLKAIGLRPISALVDITNFLTYDIGQPTHVYDAAFLNGPIGASLSQGGEYFEALDDKTYTLPPHAVVIRDAETIVALGGIMGGQKTGVGDHTVDVLVESALFCPKKIAQAGRVLGLHSDARARFERGVDSHQVFSTLLRAVQMICALCGGEAEEPQVLRSFPEASQSISVDPERFQSLGGLSVPFEEAINILKDLGFSPQKKEGHIQVCAPSWRHDITGAADIVEEVIRVRGYDQVPPCPLPAQPVTSPLTREQERAFKVRRCLAGRGLCEVVTWSFMAPHEAEYFGDIPEALRIDNPISQDLSVMRPHVLPHLLSTARNHLNRSLDFQGIFEVGPIYAGAHPEDQEIVVTGLVPLTSLPHWQPTIIPDVFHAKGHAMAVLEICGVTLSSLQSTSDGPNFYHPGRQGSLAQGLRCLARFGQIHPQVLKAFDVSIPCAGFEVFLSRLAKPKNPFPRPALNFSAYQPVTRDLAFVLDASMPAETLVKALRKAADKYVTALTLFDAFEDARQLGEGMRSLGVRIVLQSQDQTLSEDQIEQTVSKMIQGAVTATGATLRD